MYTGLVGSIEIYRKKTGDDANTFSDKKIIGYISNWSVEDTADILEFSMLGGEGYKIKKSGQQSWSASADGAVSFVAGHNHSDLFDIKAKREPVKVRFYLSTEEKTYFEGIGYIESLSVDLSAEDKGNISISISGSTQMLTVDSKLKEFGLALYINDTLQKPTA